MLDVIDYYGIDQMSDEEIYNGKKEYLNDNYYKLKQLIYDNIHNFTLEILEYYKEQAIERVEYDIQEAEFFSRNTYTTYAEEDYRNFLYEHKERVANLFDQLIYADVN